MKERRLEEVVLPIILTYRTNSVALSDQIVHNIVSNIDGGFTIVEDVQLNFVFATDLCPKSNVRE